MLPLSTCITFCQEYSTSTDVNVQHSRKPHLTQTVQPLPHRRTVQRTFRLTPLAEQLHAHHALEAAKLANIFTEDGTSYAAVCTSDEVMTRALRRATSEDMHNLLSWKEQMSRDVEAQNRLLVGDICGGSTNEQGPDVYAICGQGHPQALDPTGSAEANEAALTPVDPSMLKVDQRRAFDIAAWHLEQHLSGRSPPPLRMLIHGEGGTGKSKVIQTITENFAATGARHLLMKAAYTGVAASLIDGKTTHSIAMITRADSHVISAQTKAKLQMFWQPIEYLIIDEMSMLSKLFLARLSHNIAVGKMAEGGTASPHSFGGISVIMCGDFHQFPPVAVASTEALYFPSSTQRTSTHAQLGRAIYEEFQTVVVLTEQLRVVDVVWRDFLAHLRMGRVQQHHVAMLRQLVLTTPKISLPDSSAAPWADACLVTPRHGVRHMWNHAAVRKHARCHGGLVFQCMAEDTIKGQPPTLAQRCAIATRRSKGDSQGHRRQSDLPDMVELDIGCSVMVTQNVETDLDITNGARGTVIDIILHADEPPLTITNGIVFLHHLPAFLLVILQRTRTSALPGLQQSVIPVEPVCKTMRIQYKSAEGQHVTRTVKRRQFPMTSAYAFTDYRAQGQTIPYVIVDIARPPTGVLYLFNLYVALSRSSGRDTIRLLRDFDECIFLKTHSPELLAEDDHLALLNRWTSKWWSDISLQN